MNHLSQIFGAGSKIITDRNLIQRINLGPLTDLEGTWSTSAGSLAGWNVITVPANNADGFIFEVMPYSETLTFTPAVVALNRGLEFGISEDLQNITGLVYEQVITSSCDTPLCNQRGLGKGSIIHTETGMFIYDPNGNNGNIPNSSGMAPLGFNIMRLSTIPHGNALLALGNSTLGSDLNFPSASPNPLNMDGTPSIINLSQFGTQQFPNEFDQTNPNSFLNKANGFTFTSSSSLNREGKVTTLQFGTNFENAGIFNIPFLQKNVKASVLNATFKITSLLPKFAMEGSQIEGYQLQYSQTINMVFPIKGHSAPLVFPHITINTLSKN